VCEYILLLLSFILDSLAAAAVGSLIADDLGTKYLLSQHHSIQNSNRVYFPQDINYIRIMQSSPVSYYASPTSGEAPVDSLEEAKLESQVEYHSYSCI
jgi:hypothetical protein